MRLLYMAYRNMVTRPMASALSILLALLGVAVVSLLLQSSQAIEGQLGKNIKGIDMVVGAKGSPLSLILSSVYHIGPPNGNIPLEEANQLRSDPFVAKAIPLSFGDNYKGYRIVGSDHSYPEHYEVELAEGELWQNEMEVVLGAQVAERVGLEMGSTFHGTHGLGVEGHGHEENDYKVVGILNANGTVMDQLILTGLSSVWSIHGDHEVDSTHHREITAMLIKFRSPMGMMTLPRKVNSTTSMQAALPAIEMNSLMSKLGVGMDTLRAIAFAIILVAGISVFVALFNALRERRYEMALLRLLGMTPFKIFVLVLLEGSLIGLVGSLLGLLTGRIAMAVLSKQMEGSYHYDFASAHFLNEELMLVPAVMFICIIAAIIPAISAFRTDIAKTLSDA